jgi:aldose 1-epimerase
MDAQQAQYGVTREGKELFLYTLKNDNNVTVKITNYGCRIIELHTPDNKGNVKDIVLGFDHPDDYQKDNPYFGSILGRYANRIARGQFVLDGIEYQLARNNNANHLHGGRTGFDSVIWDGDLEEHDEGKPTTLCLTYLSPDGEENYPGNLATTVKYALTNENELIIEYQATTDRRTIVNLSNHSYFDLAGEDAPDILDHEIRINADSFTPINENFIPTGEIEKVDGTPLDFREFHTIGERIESEHEQIKCGKGYDHNFVLDNGDGSLSHAATVRESNSGRMLEVYTTEPGMQFYTGNWLEGNLTGKSGKTYEFRDALCLETQHFPDSPNNPQFPDTVLSPGERFESKTIYKFLTEA